MNNQFPENIFNNFDNKKDMLHFFLDSLPYAGAVLDKKGTIICINQKWKYMVKTNNSLMSRQEVGSNYIKLICETENQDTKLGQKATSGIENILTGKKKLFTLEYPCLTDEEKSWFKMKVKSFEDGALVLHEKIIGTAQNIAKLERKRKWAEALFKNSNSAIARLDKHHRIIDINEKFKEKFGYKLNEIKGKNLDIVLEKGKSDSTDKDLTSKVLKGHKVKKEGTRYLRDGTARNFLIKGVPVKIDAKVEGIYAIYEDITELKMKEEKLYSIFNSSLDIGYVIAKPTADKKDAIIKDMSFEAEKIFGDLTDLNKEDIIDTSISRFFSEEMVAKMPDIHRTVSKGKTLKNKTILEDNKGRKVDVLANIAPFHSGGGNKVISVFMDISELEKTRAQLQDNKEKLDATLNSIGDAVIATDTEGHITRMNPVAEKLTDWSFTSAEGKPLAEVFEIVNAKTKAFVKSPVQEVLQTGKKIGLGNHTLLISKEGQEYQIADSAAPIRDDENKVMGVVLVFRDVTDKYLMQEKLKESEERLQKILSVIPDMVSMQDTKMNIVYSNWNGLANIPKDKRNLYSKCYRTYRGYDEICPDCYAKNVLKTKNTIKKEVELPDGSWYQIQVLPILNEENQVDYFVEWVRDITQRKQREEIIKSQKQRLQNIIEGISVGTWEWNVQTGEIIFNEKWAEMLGYTLEELSPVNVETWKELTHPDDLEKAEDMLEKHFKGEIVQYDIEIRMKHKQGHWVWMQDRGQVTSWTNDGKPEWMNGIHLNITDRKKREKRIRYISYHDSLTDLYNRSYMEKEIKKIDVKDNLPVSIVMLDINGLKIINEGYGHEKGDRVLVKLAKLLRSCTRDTDIVARWSGDEFIILLPQTQKEKTKEIIKRIKDKTASTRVDDIPISVGIGYNIKTKLEPAIYKMIYKAEDKLYKDKLVKNTSIKSKLVQNMLNTLGAKSDETKEHATRMINYAFKLGSKINLSDEQLNNLSLLATLHDIGKVNIDEEILKKPSTLSEEEWEKIKEHPEKGCAIASAIEEFVPIAKGILSHHEYWDGSGYPQGLEGKEIPLLARIISIVDAYDVMTNGRPYKEAMDKKETLQELKDCAGSQFDPELVDKFIKIIQ